MVPSVAVLVVADWLIEFEAVSAAESVRLQFGQVLGVELAKIGVPVALIKNWS